MRPWTPELRGPAIFAASALGLVLALTSAMGALGWTVGAGPGGLAIAAGMWIPAIARLVATSTVDRGWKAPFPLRPWGRPRLAVIGIPLAVVTAVYLAAHLAGAAIGVAEWAPRSEGAARIVASVLFNGVAASLIGLFGALGEELGWRGYLQPRLDQAGVRYSLLATISLEILFHIPVFVFAGYLGGAGFVATVALFALLKLGATPAWTVATYATRSVWTAAWFHAIHNAIAQAVFPRLFSVDPVWLGESGILPGVAYVVAASFLLRRAGAWGAFARRACSPG